jgi:cytochrome b561
MATSVAMMQINPLPRRFRYPAFKGEVEMQLLNSAQRYGAVSQFLHWLTAILVVFAWIVGNVMEDESSASPQLFVHMSAGLAVLALVAVRLLWRLIDAAPPPEKTVFGIWGDRAARAAHLALYALLIAVPLAGIATQFAEGRPLPLFGLGQIASPWAADRAFAHNVKEVHEFLSNLILIVAGLHAVASLFHHWILRDGTLMRMLPGRRAAAGR